MHAAADRLEFAPPPTPGLVRALGLAVFAHAFLLAALTLGVNWKREPVEVTAEAELWSSVPQQAAPKLVEVPPEPVEKPLPPAVTRPSPPEPEVVQPPLPDADIALKQEKLRLKKEKQQELDKQLRLEKLKQQKLEQEKEKELLDKKRLLEKRQQDKREQEKQAADDKKKATQDAKRKEALQAEQDAKKIEAQRDANLKRIAGLAGATGGADAKGTALQSSGPSPSYAGKIRARIKPNIVFSEDVSGNPVAEVEVRAAPDGTIVGSKLIKSSGIKAWDDAVLRAIEKTETLPRDVDGRVPSPLVISFRPKD